MQSERFVNIVISEADAYELLSEIASVVSSLSCSISCSALMLYWIQKEERGQPHGLAQEQGEGAAPEKALLPDGARSIGWSVL